MWCACVQFAASEMIEQNHSGGTGPVTTTGYKALVQVDTVDKGPSLRSLTLRFTSQQPSCFALVLPVYLAGLGDGAWVSAAAGTGVSRCCCRWSKQSFNASTGENAGSLRAWQQQTQIPCGNDNGALKRNADCYGNDNSKRRFPTGMTKEALWELCRVDR